MNGVLHFTCKRTWQVFGNKRALSLGVIYIVLGTAICLLAKGMDEALNEIEKILMYGMGPIAVVSFVVFLWNLWLAPFQLLSGRIESAIAKSSDNKSGSDQNSVDRADPKNWSNVQVLQLWQAADLCAGDSPKAAGSRRTDGARAMYQQLVGAVGNEQLKTLPGRGAMLYRRVEREELQRYFASIGSTPKFLRDP